MIQLREWAALNREIRKVSRQQFSPLNSAVEQHHTRASLGLEMLQQQPAHSAGANHGNLLVLERDQLVEPPGLTELELSQFNGSRADGNGTGSEVGFTAHTLSSADGLGQQAIENRTKRFVLLTQTHHFLHLRQDLSLSQHQAVQTRRNPHQMIHRISVVVTEKVWRKISGLQTGMAAQEIIDCRDPEIRITNEGVNLKSIAGAEDGCLKHLFIPAQRLKRRLHGLLRDAELLPDFNRCRAMTEAYNGNMHGDDPLNRR